MGFPGGKAGAGVYQRIINQIPPHDIYIEPFLGAGAVMERKRPAARSIGIDINPATAIATSRRLRGRKDLDVYAACAFEWLTHEFRLNRAGARSAGDVVWCDPRSTFVYLDPPYLLTTRRSGAIYEHELTMVQHLDLLRIAKRLPCMVAISGYWSPLYEAELALESWRSISFNACTRGGRVARETLWMNYPPPKALHDYRYLGDNKRQRERVSRKVRTWAAGLARLPRLERQAILAALDGLE